MNDDNYGSLEEQQSDTIEKPKKQDSPKCQTG